MSFLTSDPLAIEADLHIRPALLCDVEPLSQLAIASKQYWGYDAAFMERCRPALRVTPELLQREQFFVLQNQDHIVGFCSLLDRSSTTAELTNLFIAPHAIRSGHGKRLWHHAIETARSQLFEELMIKSDPNAAGFYQAMGAELTGEICSSVVPGYTLPLLRFKLSPLSPIEPEVNHDSR